jgi:hypothetical protein
VQTPAILLPAARWRDWTGDELRYVLLHELAHLRQLDGPARRLEALLTALHWFNPLVWLAARRARADREPACDALVLSRLGAAERAGYGRALIRAAEGDRTQLPLPGLVGMADRSDQLRRRISMIVHPIPKSPWRAGALAALAALLAVASWTDIGALARPAGGGEPPAPGDNERLKASVQQEREIGVAMFSWLTDVIASDADLGAAEDAAGEGATEPTRLAWSECPAISYDDLAAILVPTYLAELPRTDGWGHPFEFCMNRERPGAARGVVGIRSPGRDGRWEGGVYPIGRFDPADVDRDLVWVDGYFITWPEAAEGAHAEGKPSEQERRDWRAES